MREDDNAIVAGWEEMAQAWDFDHSKPSPYEAPSSRVFLLIPVDTSRLLIPPCRPIRGPDQTTICQR